MNYTYLEWRGFNLNLKINITVSFFYYSFEHESSQNFQRLRKTWTSIWIMHFNNEDGHFISMKMVDCEKLVWTVSRVLLDVQTTILIVTNRIFFMFFFDGMIHSIEKWNVWIIELNVLTIFLFSFTDYGSGASLVSVSASILTLCVTLVIWRRNRAVRLHYFTKSSIKCAISAAEEKLIDLPCF